jgi:hypothetical protein
LNASYPVQGIYLKTWYVTTINQIQIGLHINDGYTGQQPKVGNIYIPPSTSTGWKWFNGTEITCCYNVEQTIFIPKISARYVQIRLRGGSSTYSSDWGLRQVKISKAATSITANNTELFSFGTSIGNISYKPPVNANIRVAAYTNAGSLLGVLTMRNATRQRPLLEQSLTTMPLSPYSNDAWSATLPWNWMREGTLILIGTSYPNVTSLALNVLRLNNLAAWSHHTLSRTKVVIFGNATDIASLETSTHDSSLLAKGMFNSMPLSELRWEDAVWYLPYLVVTTSKGPKLVNSEAQRRQVMTQAGDIPGDEPPWQVLKEWGSNRHRVANIGLGLSRTTESCCDSSEYASGTSIFMGWALTSNATGKWTWNHIGYWEYWSAAAWVGWCGMVPGDECGNTLSHELGHSQTMGHFVDVRPEIADEYPLAGVNMPWHPWGYDTTSRRFRTWYKASDPSKGKYDPMNGGEDGNKETCFPQYTAYHAKWSQDWAWDSPVLLAAGMGQGVTSAGAYIYSKSSRKYEKLTQQTIQTAVKADATIPVEVSVPVATIFGTIGNDLSVCQIYPALFGSAGNTFALPTPLTANLPSVFTNAAHYVEIRFKDGTTERALIAIPKLLDATELRHFSLTVAVSRQPVAADLYQYDSAAYPGITSASTKRLLFSRSIDVSSSALNKALRGVVRVGRGWLGGSTKMIIDSVCISKQDCLTRAATLKWAGAEGGQITFESVNIAQSASSAEGSQFVIKAMRQQDGLPYSITILATRFYDDNGVSTLPLLDQSQQVLQPDALFGATFSIPYDLNKDLGPGTYFTNSSDDMISIKANQPGGSIFAAFNVSVDFKILASTATADISTGKVYTSTETFYTPDSFVYFLVTDPSIGPTTGTWCGGDRDTLTVQMFSSCTDQVVTASIKAQQLACGGYGQMSSGRGANNCGHQIVLTLDPYNLALNQNTWLVKFPGCTFATHPGRPVPINAFRWHEPEAGKLLGSVILKIQVTTPSLPMKPSKPARSPSSPNAKPFLVPAVTKPAPQIVKPFPAMKPVPVSKPKPVIKPVIKPAGSGPVRKPAPVPVVKPVASFPKPALSPTVALSSSLPTSCSLIEENVSFPGNDLSTASSSKAEGCCSICAITSGCKAFSWSSGTCFLKTGKSSSASSSGTRSAVLGSSYCASKRSDVDFYGNDIASVPGLSADECCLACKLTNGCTAFTWFDGICWVKNFDTTGTAFAGAVSGTLWL